MHTEVDELKRLLKESIEIIDKELGDKYAIKNPRLLAEILKIKIELEEKGAINESMQLD